ncbi:alpha-2-macroglobulin domain protein [Chitinispirillum alkaliphilum]|nr:alpha-2-macroglobulin domain protein [Chitinispirillum alkaliphilum]
MIYRIFRLARISPLFFLMLLCSIIARDAFSQPYSYRSADRDQLRADENVRILPSLYLREYDPITIFFDRNVFRNAPGPLDEPGDYLNITPFHPGEYRILDRRTLEFRPTIPWEPLKTYTIRSANTSQELQTLLSVPRSITPEPGSTNLEELGRIGFEFSTMVDTSILRELVTFTACPLPGIEMNKCPALSPSDFRIKMSNNSENSFTYWFIFNTPFGYGQKIRAILNLANQSELNDAQRIYSFDTRPEFSIDKAGTFHQLYNFSTDGVHYDSRQALRISGEGSIVLEFTAPPADPGLSVIKSLVNFSPSPPNFQYTIEGNRILIKPEPETERLYKVTLRPVQMQDRNGRNLHMQNSSSFYVYKPAASSFVRWQRGYGIIETHGPQHFPVSIQGLNNNIDLRIYKIDPLHRAFQPFPSSPVIVNEASRPPGPGEEPVASESIINPLGSQEIAAHIQMLGSPHGSVIIDCEREGVNRFGSIDLSSLLDSAGMSNKSGTFLIGLRTLDGSSERSYVRIDVTDLCLSTVEAKNKVLFTVTSYSTGRPVPGAKITIEGVMNNKHVVIADGTTGRDGVFTLNHDPGFQNKFNRALIRRIIVRKEDDVLVLPTRSTTAPNAFVNNHWYGRRSEWLQWITSERYSEQQDRKIRAFIRTERPLYRPEDTVFVKGYVRETSRGEILFPSEKNYSLQITSPSGARFNHKVELSEHGSFDLRFKEENLPTGRYRVSLFRTCEEASNAVANTDFEVEAYRLPRFEIIMSGPDKAPNDRPAEIGLSASYYAGGRVVEQNVDWRITSYPYTYRPAGMEGYILSSDSRYGAVRQESQQGVLLETSKTDDNGQSQITINPQTSTDGNPRRYIVEATVTDADQQTVSNRHSLITLPPFILGLKTERHITSGTEISADVIALDVNGEITPEQKVNVQLKRMSWISYLTETDFSRGSPKYVTNESVDLVAEKDIVTGAEPVNVVFPDQTPGVYIIELSSRDRLGRLQTVRTDLFLAGSTPVTWSKPDHHVFETVTDQAYYTPGQNAKILLKSPYQNARALAIVEHPDGDPVYEWMDIRDGQGTFTLAVTPEMTPRIPVSFLLMRPRIASPQRTPDGVHVDPGKPETMANTTFLTVKPTSYMLDVKLTHETTVLPDGQLEIEISLSDMNGSPRAGEVTLWLIDEAVLSLRREKSLDPIEAFIEPVQSHISMRDSRNMALGNLRVRETPGGDGMRMLRAQETFGKVTVRKNFKTVPYWNPSISIGNNGTKTVTVQMPSDLTNFGIRAMAVSEADMFGFERSRVSVRLPVIVQPAMPRFVRLGDKFRAGGIGRVVEGEGGEATWGIESEGLRINQSGAAQVTLDNARPVQLFSDAEVIVPDFDPQGNMEWDSVSVRVFLIRDSDKAADAFELKIPLLLDRPYVEESMFSEIQTDTPFTFPALPEKARNNTVFNQLLISDRLQILNTISAMTLLLRYPHECSESLISQAYPTLLYRDLWNQLGIEPPETESLTKLISRTIEYLSRTQRSDGLFGYWPGSRGYVHLTAYAVEFLTEVKRTESDYPFDERMYERAIAALKRSLRTDYTRFVSGYSYYERSSALLALAKAGQLDIGYARELAAMSREVDIQSRSKILQALASNPEALSKEYSALENSLWNQTMFRMEDGEEVFAGLQQRDMRIGARVHADEITALSAMISALSNTNETDKLSKMLNQLTVLGSDGDWGNTYATSMVLLALRDNVQTQSSGSQGSFDFLLGDESETILFDGSSPTVTKMWSDEDGGSVILTGERNGQFWARLNRRFLPLSPGSEAEPQQRGFVVKRSILRITEGQSPQRIPIEKGGDTITVSSGDIIEEHIQVVNPEKRLFTAISVPIAAGFEPMNPRLDNAERNAQPMHRNSHEADYSAFMDDQVIFFFEEMEAGTYDFYFRVRAVTEGDFSHPPARAEMMYQMGVYGSSAGTRVVVE